MLNRTHWWTSACRRTICILTHCIRIEHMLEYSKFTWKADAIYEIWSYLYYSLCIANTLIGVHFYACFFHLINFTPHIKAENILIWVIVFHFKAPLITMMSWVKDIWKSTGATKTKYYNVKSFFFSPVSQTKWTWNLIACACPYHCLKHTSHIKGTLPNILFTNVRYIDSHMTEFQ